MHPRRRHRAKRHESASVVNRRQLHHAYNSIRRALAIKSTLGFRVAKGSIAAKSSAGASGSHRAQHLRKTDSSMARRSPASPRRAMNHCLRATSRGNPPTMARQRCCSRSSRSCTVMLLCACQLHRCRRSPTTAKAASTLARVAPKLRHASRRTGCDPKVAQQAT